MMTQYQWGVTVKVSTICLIVLSLLCSIRPSEGQNEFGDPPFCLISRQDVLPCNVSIRSSPPNASEYGIYPTRITLKPRCRIRANPEKGPIPIFRKIDQISDVLLMFSPGSFTAPPINYPNNLLLLFNIRCPGENQLAYFVLNNITLEERNCFDPNLGVNRCVDFLQVDQNQETCGQDTSPFTPILSFQNREFTVTFRTSGSGTFSGFRATAVCMTPQDANAEGCTEGVSGMPTSRKKRNTEALKDGLETFHNMRREMQGSLATERHKRNCRPGHFSIEGRNITTLVPFGVNMIYRGERLTFVDEATGAMVNSRDNRLLAPLTRVTSLETFDLDEERNLTGSFTKTAVDSRGRLIEFPGLGQLSVTGHTAMYELFPPEVLPTEQEEVAIAELTSVLFDAIPEQEPLPPGFFDDLSPSIDELKEAVFPCSPSCAPRQERKKRGGLSQMNLAQENINACNPVLQASARAVEQFMSGPP